MINALNFNNLSKTVSFSKGNNAENKKNNPPKNLERQPEFDIFENMKNSKTLTPDDIKRIEAQATRDEFGENPDDTVLLTYLMSGGDPDVLTKKEKQRLEAYVEWN